MRIPNAIQTFINSLMNQLLLISIFATYVYLGNTMSVATTALATIMINRIKGPVNTISNFYQNWLNIESQLTLVHEYLSADESQPNVMLRSCEETDVAVRVRGNFSFGLLQTNTQAHGPEREGKKKKKK